MTLPDPAIRGTSGCLDALVGAVQYADHLAPVWAGSPDRGTLWTTDAGLRDLLAGRYPGADVRVLTTQPLARPILVASHADFARVRRRTPPAIAYMDHGCGQSYPGDAGWKRHPSYAGGSGYERVGLFLAPNRHAAERWTAAYPGTPVRVIGATRALPGPAAGADPLLVVSFHWPGPVPELRSAIPWYRASLPRLRDLPAALHAHPRHASSVRRVAAAAGLPFIEDLEEVAARATVYAVDNSSTLWELGMTRPAIAMNIPDYRRHVRHGLRFWSHALSPVDDGPGLIATATRFLAGGETEEERERREVVCRDVLPMTSGAATATQHLADWRGVPQYPPGAILPATSLHEGQSPEGA